MHIYSMKDWLGGWQTKQIPRDGPRILTNRTRWVTTGLPAINTCRQQRPSACCVSADISQCCAVAAVFLADFLAKHVAVGYQLAGTCVKAKSISIAWLAGRSVVNKAKPLQ
jgi:hypothetical protein